jgi:hypothetical protein
MSEPVGNSPRGTNIPGNSHKEREALPKEGVLNKEVAPREPVEKIVEGKVVKSKQSLFKRMTRSLIADDAQSIGDFLIVDVVVPAIKNLIADTVKGGTDRVLFGQSRARRAIGVGGESRSLRTRYDKYAEAGEPRRMMSRESRARHDFDEVRLDDRAEAIEVVETLIARVEKFGAASVSDLYDLVGVTGSYADQRWGWTDLREADVRQSRGGWLLDLPRPEPLR